MIESRDAIIEKQSAKLKQRKDKNSELKQQGKDRDKAMSLDET